jgi:hypothetical protein
MEEKMKPIKAPKIATKKKEVLKRETGGGAAAPSVRRHLRDIGEGRE